MYIGLCLAVAIVGGVMFCVAKDGNYKEIGKIMLFCGLLAFLLGAEPLIKNGFGSRL